MSRCVQGRMVKSELGVVGGFGAAVGREEAPLALGGRFCAVTALSLVSRLEHDWPSASAAGSALFPFASRERDKI